MTTAIDTNVLSALLNATEKDTQRARAALLAASQEGLLVVAPVVHAELCAAPNADETFVDDFLTKTRISVRWSVSEETWRQAAHAYRAYANRRRKQKGGEGPRRILADFIVGAHALQENAQLLTFDQRHFRNAFPDLVLASV